MEDNNKRKFEPEIDFRNLLKNPKRLFGWVFPYFFFILLLAGIFFVKNLNTISMNDLPVHPPVEDNVKRTLEMKKGSTMPPVDLSVIINPPTELINNGKELYQNNCASCHGNNGLGDGPAGAALNPPPRNFTTTDGWTNGRDFVQMYKTLEEGIPQNGMAAYEYMPPIDRIAMIQYIRTLADFPEITEEQVQEVESTYQLTQGRQTQNQIPVELAVEKVIAENSISNKVTNLVNYVNNHPNLEGAQIFNDVVVNKYRVLSAFVNVNLTEMNLQDFISVVNSNFLELGFSADVNILEQNEWQSLFNYIKNVLGTVSV